MPIGPFHHMLTVEGETTYANAVADKECRCLIGEDHDQNGVPFDLPDDEDGGEHLSVDDAADIWRSHGMDEDYMFGYSEDELRNA